MGYEPEKRVGGGIGSGSLLLPVPDRFHRDVQGASETRLREVRLLPDVDSLHKRPKAGKRVVGIEPILDEVPSGISLVTRR